MERTPCTSVLVRILVAGAGGTGISLAVTSNGNLVTRNSVSGCGTSGIGLFYAAFNSLTWNLAATNGSCGIAFGSGAARNVYAYNRTPNNGTGGVCDPGGTNVNGGGNIYP